jgi:GT2 family glycosyltransferase
LKVLAVISTLAQDTVRLNESIESLKSHSGHHAFEILVVNNSGQAHIDGLAPIDYVVSPGINLGYVGALELARRTHQSDFLWSIQDDMTLQNGVLDILLSEMEKSPRLAVCSPVLVRNGQVPARTRAGVFTNAERTRWENHPVVDTKIEDFPSDVDYSFVSGSGALFRNAALEDVGGFNLDLYPLMHVDVDVCARFLSNGWKIALAPEAHINHQIQGSTPRVLGEVLDRRNKPIVEQRLAGEQPEHVGLFDSIDNDIMSAVARRASFLFLEVSREANIRLDDAGSQVSALQSQLNEAHSQLHGVLSRLEEVESQIQEIKRSTSWRVSAPIRMMGRILRLRRKQ